ncbi:CPBP family intramembrane glutamic endopeptidase [Streptococcus dentiloxodontae]
MSSLITLSKGVTFMNSKTMIKRFVKITGLSLVWLVLFGLTVNLGLSHDLFNKYFGEKGMIVAGSLLNLIGLAVLAYRHQNWTGEMFQVRQKQILWLYAILILAAVSLPWHYHWTDLPVVYYLLFTIISVFWQDYLTFGLLQRYLQEELSFKWRIIFLPLLFLSGHFLYISHFGTKPMMVVLTFVMALLFTYLREKTQTLHWLLFLHLMFYFATA